MSTRTRMMTLAMAATTLATATSLTACDPEGEALQSTSILDADDLQFRCQIIGGCGDGEKTNDMFAGDGEYAISYIPLEPGAHPTIDLNKIETERCYDRTGTEIWGEFEVYDPSLSVSNGEIQSFQVRDATDPAFVCDAYGQALENSLWYMTGDLLNAQGGLDTVDVKLKIDDIVDDGEGRTLYEWHSDRNYLYGGGPSGFWRTCDQAPDAPASMQYHAMLYPELEVNTSNNTFDTKPDIAYNACVSGTIGKTAVLWDYDTTNITTAQVAANAAMAAYCGDGKTHTVTGTKIDLWNINGVATEPDYVEPDTSVGGDFELEAVWNANNEAICIGRTRLPGKQPALGADFQCVGGDPIPPCDAAVHLVDPTAVLATYTYVGAP